MSEKIKIESVATPWFYATNHSPDSEPEDMNCYIYGDVKEDDDGVNHATEIAIVTPDEETNQRREGTAKLILRAVNLHDEMVEALMRSESLMRSVEFGLHTNHAVRVTGEIVRAVLAKVEDQEKCCICGEIAPYLYAEREDLPSCGRGKCEFEMMKAMDYNDERGV